MVKTKKKNYLNVIFAIWSHFSNRRKTQFSFLLVLTIFTSFAEILSLGTLIPFLAALTDPVSLFQNPTIRPMFEFLNISSADEILLPLTLFFTFSIIIAGIMRLTQAYANVRVSYATGADLSIKVYEKTLYQPYNIHVSRNSSSIINAVYSKSMGVVSGGILPLITIITSTTIMLSIISTLIVVDPVIALISFFSFGLIYLLVILLTRRKLHSNGLLIARKSDLVIKSLQEGLGGIRDVLISGSQKIYKKVFSNSIFPLRRAEGNNLFIALSPRFSIEAIGMVLIAILAYHLVKDSGNLIKAIPTLGALAFGAQRVLPIFQQIYAGISTIRGNFVSLKDVLDLLEQEIPEKSNAEEVPLKFEDNIVLKNIFFRYKKTGSYVIDDFSLKILKGSKVGFIGTTGSGKSTTLDLIMGLLTPNSGYIEVDGNQINNSNINSWQKNITHVPQSIFLSDSSISENIAFGTTSEKIDQKRVKWAASVAQIDHIISNWEDGYKTIVGERGVRLSGGQCQRIGIARALYQKSNLIILDEATSALDNDTEVKVMEAIENLNSDFTILIIAHRLTTLRNCDKIVELKNGKIERIGTYKEIVSSSR